MQRGVGVRVPLSAQKAIVLIDSRFFAFKGTRTFGSASDDLSSVGSDVPRCNATMGMRRE